MKRYYKHIAVLLMLVSNLFITCMLNNIKDTDSILHDDYKYLSLVDGAIAWETGVIRRLYDLGQIFPVYKQDNRGRKIIQGYENQKQTSEMVRLIHAFFYRVPGSTGQADFGATVQLAIDDPFVVVQTIAKIITLCQNIQAQDQAFQKAVRALATHKNLQGLALKVINNPLAVSGKNRAIWRMFLDQAYAKKNQPGYVEHVANVQVVTQFCENLAAIQNQFNKLLKFQALLGAEMGEVILGALRESDPENPNVLYPAHTVEMIFLAFVYKKYSYDRNVLKVFYDELNAQLGEKVLVRALDEQWVTDSFPSLTQAQVLNILETIFAAEDLMHSIKQHFAELVYSASQDCFVSAPSLIDYAKATYEYEKGKKTEEVADCMDNAIRNFINLYAYDAEQNKFTFAKLLATMRIMAVHPALMDFLNMFGDVNTASSVKAHNAWFTLISNIPYVAYNRMRDGSTDLSAKALDTGKGYISIPENERTFKLRAWSEINGYQVLATNQYGYELQPSVKNIIIVLDHLLTLNLFSKEGGLAKEFMRPDFIKEYFPKLCAAIKAAGSLLVKGGAVQSEVSKDFDALDYTGTTIYTTIDSAKIKCNFKTDLSHGELNLNIIPTNNQPFSFLEKINNFAGQPSLSLLATDLICKQGISFAHLENNPNYLYIKLFAAPLENTGNVDHIIRAFSYRDLKKFPLIAKINSMYLLLRVADLQPDEAVGLSKKLQICKEFLGDGGLSEEDLKNNPDLVHTIEKVVLQGMAKDQDMRLFVESLMNKGQSFAIAAQYAEKLMLSDKHYERIFAKDRLFAPLLNKNQGIKEAISAVEQLIDKSWPAPATILLQLLFAKELGLQEALQAAEKAMASDDYGKQNLGVDIFKMLFQKGVGFEEALRSAQKAVESKDAKQRELGMNLFTELVKKDYAFKEAVLATQRIDWYGKDVFMEVFHGFDLFKALVEKGQALVEAMAFATKPFVLNRIGRSLLEETKQAIQKALADPNVSSDVKQKLRNLLNK